MKMINRAAALMLAALLCGPLAAGAQENTAIASSVVAALEVSRAPGASIAITEHGTLVFEQGFGVLALIAGTPALRTGEAIVGLENSSGASPDIVSGQVFSAVNPELAKNAESRIARS